jgi:hypothetical protein
MWAPPGSPTLRRREDLPVDDQSCAVRSFGVKLLRRALGALMMAAAIAGALRVRGRGGTPPQHGGWQPVELPEQ